MKPIPQYRKLYETLRKHIVGGVYKEGDLLPSENELCQLHGMTRPTVRQSLGALANDGYIRKEEFNAHCKDAKDMYVTQDQYSPVKKIVYGAVSLVLTAVFGALIYLVIKN